MKLKKGDTVEVVAGKDKGKKGKIEKTFPGLDKVAINGVNEFKRHVKGKVQGQKSEIVTLTKPIAVANVAIICSKCKQQSRIGYKMIDDKKIRICKKCEEEL